MVTFFFFFYLQQYVLGCIDSEWSGVLKNAEQKVGLTLV